MPPLFLSIPCHYCLLFHPYCLWLLNQPQFVGSSYWWSHLVSGNSKVIHILKWVIPPSVLITRRTWNSFSWYFHQTLLIMKSPLDGHMVLVSLKSQIYLDNMKRQCLFIFSKEADETKRNASLYKTVSKTLSILNESVKKQVRGKGAELRIQWHISDSHALKQLSSTHDMFCWVLL